MTIFLENQFVCRFSVANYTDFILLEDLRELTYIETAGNVLPVMTLKFVLRDMDIANFLNQGNIFNMSIGRTQLDLIDMQFLLIGDNMASDWNVNSTVTIQGVLYVPQYSLVDRTDVHADMTSFEVIETVTMPYFKFKSNAKKVNDKMNWHQLNVNDKAFLRKVWLHSYINSDTFLAFAVDCDTVYFKDIKAALTYETPWRFTISGVSSESSKLIHYGQVFVKNDYGTTSRIAGQLTDVYDTDLTFGNTKITNPTLKNLTTLDTNKLNVLAKDNSQKQFTYSSSEYHPRYHQAYNQNVKNLVMFSTLRSYISIAGQFKTLKLLDLVNIDNDSPDPRNTGLGFVTGLVYQIKDKRLVTNITICKEGANGMQGDLR